MRVWVNLKKRGGALHIIVRGEGTLTERGATHSSVSKLTSREERAMHSSAWRGETLTERGATHSSVSKLTSREERAMHSSAWGRLTLTEWGATHSSVSARTSTRITSCCKNLCSSRKVFARAA